jgi:lipopolysaccharide export system protein LptC
MYARAETSEQRLQIFNALNTRNRVVAILRIGVPIIGVVVFLGLVAQIFIAGFANDFGIGRVTVNGDSVTVDTPTFSGIMGNGNTYKVSAEGARTALADLNVIDLQKVTVALLKPGGVEMTARADTASLETIRQTAAVPGTAHVSDSTGSTGTLAKVFIDWPRQAMKADKVSFQLAGGATLDADSLDYDARTAVWTFKHATLTLPDLPGDTP